MKVKSILLLLILLMPLSVIADAKSEVVELVPLKNLGIQKIFISKVRNIEEK